PQAPGRNLSSPLDEIRQGSRNPGNAPFGSPVRRREDPRLITGRGRYVSDVEAPRLLHVAFVRSAHAHARLRAIDITAAAAHPGVLAVLTGKDARFPELRIR